MNGDSRLVLPTRRTILKGATGAAALGLVSPFPKPALAQGAPLKVGFMLPYTGTFAKLGKFIDEASGSMSSRRAASSAGAPSPSCRSTTNRSQEAATDNMNRLVGREKVDVVVGTVHSGVAMAMVKVARDTNTLLIIPNAGANEATGPACAPNIFRTSFSNWQPAFPMGKVMADAGHKNIVTITWRYAAGQQMVDSFKENLAQTGAGAKIVEELYLPFPEVEFQSLITRIATLRPDAAFSFFARRRGEVREGLRKGLKDKIPLYGTGFLTDGTLEAQGEAANGIKTTLHYADNLDNPANKAFLDASRRKRIPTATSMPCRATTRRRSSTSACGSRRRRRRARQDDRRDGGREDRPAARADQLLEGAQRRAEHLSARGAQRAERIRLRGARQPR